MADVEWPSDLVPYKMTFYFQHHTTVFESPFTRQQQVLGRSAPRWVAQMSFRGGAGGATLSHGVGARIEALLMQLKGPQKTVTLYDFRRPSGRGVLRAYDDYAATVPETFFTDDTDFTDGTGFFVGPEGPPSSAASGNTVVFTHVWPFTRPRELGDYIGFGDGRPHMITDAPLADENGRVTLTFEPALTRAVAADSHDFSEIRGTFRLTSDDAGMNATGVDGFAGYELDFVEILPVV